MVRMYATKSVTVDAWQRISGPETLPVWVPQYVEVEPSRSGWNFYARHNVTVRKPYAATRGEDEERRTKIECGDWLVVDQDGAFLYDDRIFKQRYELIAQGSGGQ